MTTDTAVTPVTKHTWATNQLLFMAWLALPATRREPRAQKDLASQFGVREATLSDWKLLPGFGEEVYRLSKAFVRSSDLVDIVRAQVSLAKDTKKGAASTQAARFIFEMVGVMEPGGGVRGSEVPAGGAASALAMVMNINVSGKDVDDIAAERAAARQLLQQQVLKYGDEEPGA